MNYICITFMERKTQDYYIQKKIDSFLSKTVDIWWSRGESNPCPKATWKELLRAQFVIYIPSSQREQTLSGNQ